MHVARAKTPGVTVAEGDELSCSPRPARTSG